MKTTTGKPKQQPPMPKRFFLFNLNRNPKMIKSEFSASRYMATGRVPREVTGWVETTNGTWFMHDPRPKFSIPFSKKRCQTRLSRSEKILRGEK